MNHLHISRLLCFIVFLALGSVAAFAQGGSTGALAGTAADPSGAVVVNAIVVVKNTETGQEFRATTSNVGAFNVPALGTGNYTITITAQGFKQALVQGVKVDVGKT